MTMSVVKLDEDRLTNRKDTSWNQSNKLSVNIAGVSFILSIIPPSYSWSIPIYPQSKPIGITETAQSISKPATLVPRLPVSSSTPEAAVPC
mmetsp:Transcript_32318/g.78276  ORF Transcript_32318/g.78276 Transcript_32318/m.78276 type:complete len:91 (-) Transcript_32318:1610-1882(-)